MGKGPSFKKHYRGEPIHLVDIYQIYAHILGIEPQTHDGSWSRVRSYLTNSSVKIQLTAAPLFTIFLAFLVNMYA